MNVCMKLRQTVHCSYICIRTGGVQILGQQLLYVYWVNSLRTSESSLSQAVNHIDPKVRGHEGPWPHSKPAPLCGQYNCVHFQTMAVEGVPDIQVRREGDVFNKGPYRGPEWKEASHNSSQIQAQFASAPHNSRIPILSLRRSHVAELRICNYLWSLRLPPSSSV
jgi:hypothetical protein